jgi:serine/threonine protein kinase
MRQPTGLLAERYEVITEVPEGFASSCYFGIDTSVGRAVVIRLVGSNSASWLAASRLAKHRHLAAITDVLDDPDPDAFPGYGPNSQVRAIVAEVFRGTSLRSVIRRERLCVDRSVAWTLRIAESLRSLHTQGGAHGALSPFSILARAHGRPISPVITQLLVPPMGLFASPERLSGEGPSPSDDLWALGVLLYCLLTGGVPFHGDTPGELLRAIQATSRAQLTLKSGPYMRELESAVRRWLAPARHRRPSNVDDIIETLDRWERRSPAGMQPLAANTSDRRAPNLSACLAEGDDLIFDDSQIPDSYDAALAAVQEERNIPRTAHPYEGQEGFTELTPISGVSLPPPPDSPLALSIPPGSIALSPSMIPPELAARRPLESESFGLRRRRPRWGLFLLFVVLGAGVGAAVVSLFGSPSNVARTVAKVVQQRSFTGQTPAPAQSTQEYVNPKLARERCIRAYFPADAFGTQSDLDFVCKNENLMEVTQRLNALAVSAPDGGVPTARSSAAIEPSAAPSASVSLVVKSARVTARTWQLGWYELLAASIIQRTCCQEPPAIKLPLTTGWCQQLHAVVTNIANQSTKPGDLAPAIRAFDETITCLMSQGKHTVYPYKSAPSEAHRAAFQQFLTKAAEMDALRASKKF